MSELIATGNPRGHWFQTYKGTKYFAMDPRKEDVDIEDIAHSLSFICRYGGHCRDFYSVAQHSIYVRDCLVEEFPNEPLLHLQGLIHDAAEAYVGDMKRPIKESMPIFKSIEEYSNIVVHEGLHVPLPSKGESLKIKWSDNTILMAERRDIMNHKDIPWDLSEEPWHSKIVPWNHPEDGFMEFMSAWIYTRMQWHDWIKTGDFSSLMESA